MIDRRLHTLRAVHQHGSITAAARVLHFTPSAVSQQLRQLATELGVDVLEQHGRGVRLTAAGLTLVEHADTLFAAWEAAQADLAAHAPGVGGELRICGFPTAMPTLIVPAVQRLARDHPLLELRVRESCERAPALLLAHEADIAVMSTAPDTPSLDDRRFEQQPLLDEFQDLLVPRGHPLAGRDEIELGEAAGETWIVASLETSEQREITLAACAASGFSPAAAHEARDWSAVAALVAGGLGVALVPGLAIMPTNAAVERVPISGEVRPSRRIVTCVRRGSGDHPTIRYGLEALHDACASRTADSVIALDPVA